MVYLVTCAYVFLQPCSPSLEYPRIDLPKNVRFIGAYSPKKIVSETTQLPVWWDELLAAKKQGKKIVFVTQETFQLDFNMLLKPTIEALADREDVFVVGVLGQRGTTIDGFQLPASTRVVDYLLYDAVLLNVDVLVSNAGYTGFLHSVLHGVPMVLADRGRKFSTSIRILEQLLIIGIENKAEVCMRGEYAGTTLNLNTDSPSIEALRDGTIKVLGDSSFKTRCVQTQRENEVLDNLAQVERVILEFARA